MVDCHDLIVIGGGIVGLATAHAFLQRRPGSRVLVLEKEASVGQHQTGRNSGVIHSGIYYKPGSLKAETCRTGARMLLEFASHHRIRHEICGKVIVATNGPETERLSALRDRGIANGVPCRELGPEELREWEPHVAGLRALHVPETGIIDYIGVCETLVREMGLLGGNVSTGSRVTALKLGTSEVSVETTESAFVGSLVVNCAGLHSDRMVQMTGQKRPARIVPFRGEYFELQPSSQHLCRNLIYPVPDPAFPFLGVHFTRMVLGGVECGPNAVLAFSREGYRKTQVHLRDLWDVVSYGGFWRLARRHWRTGSAEMWRSLSKAAFVKSLQRLIPSVKKSDLHTAPAGVRAQALRHDGGLVDDFLIQEHGRIVHVCNAPSPAATSSLAIGEAVVNRLVAVLEKDP